MQKNYFWFFFMILFVREGEVFHFHYTPKKLFVQFFLLENFHVLPQSFLVTSFYLLLEHIRRLLKGFCVDGGNKFFCFFVRRSSSKSMCMCLQSIFIERNRLIEIFLFERKVGNNFNAIFDNFLQIMRNILNILQPVTHLTQKIGRF